MFGGPSIVFKCKAVADEIFILDSTNWCKSIVGIDATQLYPFLMYQAMPTGLYKRWDLDSESGKLKPRQNMTRTCENLVMSYFERVRLHCIVEKFYTTSAQKKTDAYSVDDFFRHCNIVFEAIGCYYHYCLCQEAGLFAQCRRSSEMQLKRRAIRTTRTMHTSKVF